MEWLGAGLLRVPRGEGMGSGPGQPVGVRWRASAGSVSPHLRGVGPVRTPLNSWDTEAAQVTHCPSSQNLPVPYPPEYTA